MSHVTSCEVLTHILIEMCENIDSSRLLKIIQSDIFHQNHSVQKIFDHHTSESVLCSTKMSLSNMLVALFFCNKTNIIDIYNTYKFL